MAKDVQNKSKREQLEEKMGTSLSKLSEAELDDLYRNRFHSKDNLYQDEMIQGNRIVNKNRGDSK